MLSPAVPKNMRSRGTATITVLVEIVHLNCCLHDAAYIQMYAVRMHVHDKHMPVCLLQLWLALIEPYSLRMCMPGPVVLHLSRVQYSEPGISCTNLSSTNVSQIRVLYFDNPRHAQY